MGTVRDLLTRFRSGLRATLRSDPDGSALTLITVALVAMAVAISYIVFAPRASQSTHTQAESRPAPSAEPAEPSGAPYTQPSAQPSAHLSAQPSAGPSAEPS